MKNFTIIFPLFFLPLFLLQNTYSYAAEIDNIVNEQNRVIQNQQQFEQDQRRKNELQNMEIERKSGIIEEDLRQEEPDEVDLKKQCSKINKIIFVKNKILSRAEEQSLTESYIGKCLRESDVRVILRVISDYIIEKEYITSKAKLSSQDFSSGELVIEVVEGKLEDLIFNDDEFFDKTQKFSAFGKIKKNEPLSLHDVVIGLDQINRLSSNSASVKMIPGSYLNSSIISVQNNPKNTLRTTFSFDDLGSESTGKRRDTIGLSYDNLLQLNDNLNLSRTANDFSHHKNLGKNESLNFSFSVPFKGNLLSFSHSRYYYSLVQGNIVKFKASGQSASNSATLESILFKRKKYRLKSQISLFTRDLSNYINETKIDTSSRKSSIAKIAFPNKFFFDKATILLKPSYSRGLEMFDAKKDAKDISSRSAHAQFDMLKFYANYSHALQVPVLNLPFRYNLSFDGQISKQRLFSNDQFFIGGAYTVRGFENGSIGGDSGYLIQNSVNFNLGQMILPLLPKPKAEIVSDLYKFSIAPFYDYGYVKTRGTNIEGRLAGGGFKTSFYHKNLTANLTLSWVANKSVLLQNNYSENQAVYFDITTNFGFF